ncbi:MAG: hypothetical protein HYW86_01835 [Candidatus Roizmanbacteria bacterium]|nr:MAG: hypothetical protein HYW86_01835 [Candidatus Roizmanbacteria bacterium]
MPHKTKKTKILSEQRKKLKLLELNQVTQKEESKTELQDKKTVIDYSLTDEEIKIKRYFLQDFKKSLLIIGLIFSLEIILYFASMSNYVSELLKF